MELVLTGRGVRITEQVRNQASRKLQRLLRLEPLLTRIELEIIEERNPRRGGTKHLEASVRTARKVFRAHADGREIEAALDTLTDRLERQLRDHHERRRRRPARRPNRLESAGAGPESAPAE